MRCLIIQLSYVVVVFCLVLCLVEGKRLGVSNYPVNFNLMGGLGHEKENYQNHGIDMISTSLLHDIHERSGPNYNIVLSPISIWMILAMLWEGAAGVTEDELKRKLGLRYWKREEGINTINSQYRRLKNIFQARNTSTEFTSLNFFISDKLKYLSPEFENIIRTNYDGEIFRVAGTSDKDKYSRLINSWAIWESGNRIRSLVTPEVFNDLVLIVGNAIFLKSKWKHPFNPQLTALMPFMDEKGNVLSQIPMMSQMVTLPYKYSEELESRIVEIPYEDGLTSMIVILPEKGVTLLKVLRKIRNKSLKQIVRDKMETEPLNLILPRFSAVSELNLNEFLNHDLRSMFSSSEARFPYLGNDIFVTRILHKGKIENTEEGTTSSALTSVDFVYKNSVTVFRANRPFIYFINEIETRLPLLVGTYSNPF